MNRFLSLFDTLNCIIFGNGVTDFLSYFIIDIEVYMELAGDIVKKKFIMMILLSSLLTPVFALDEAIYSKEMLNEELLKIDNQYTFSNHDQIKENLLSIINEKIDDSIEKDITCSLDYCNLVLKYKNISSDEKRIEIHYYDSKEEDTTSEENIEIEKKSSITYQSHVQDIGWQNVVGDGDLSGTEHQSKRLEAIKIFLTGNIDGSIEYSSHVQDIGWQNYVGNGILSGTEHQSKRLEAIKIRLVGDVSNYYDIYYRVHIEDFGWLGWTKNGEAAGSQGLGKRLESIQIKLVEKNDTSISTDEKSFVIKNTTIQYQVHGQDYGTQEEVLEGNIAGTTGKSKRVEAFQIHFNTSLNGNIIYNSFVEGKGWEEEDIEDHSFSGTMGQAKAIQLIRISLTDEIAEEYDIYYRVHSANYGWLGWAKNGEIAGVNHYSIEAIQIKLFFKKDSNKNQLPTKNHYIEKVSYKPVYYNQKDARWNRVYYGKYPFGSTGCAPTSMAMAFQGILGRTILPTDVANYLYSQTNEFNKRTQGSSGQAIVKAAEYYGVKRTAIESKEELIEALKDGKIVFAAMGNGRFGKKKYNHAIIFYGYNSKKNTTNVMDPLQVKNNTATSIDLIWREQSTDPDDYSGGSNFHSLERY